MFVRVRFGRLRESYIFLATALLSVALQGCAGTGYGSNEPSLPDLDLSQMSTTSVGAAGGALLGAGVGTLIGSTSGSAGGGMVVGSLAGAAAGGAIGAGLEGQDKALDTNREAVIKQQEIIDGQQREIESLRSLLDEKFSKSNRPSKANKDYSYNTYKGSSRARPLSISDNSKPSSWPNSLTWSSSGDSQPKLKGDALSNAAAEKPSISDEPSSDVSKKNSLEEDLTPVASKVEDVFPPKVDKSSGSAFAPARSSGEGPAVASAGDFAPARSGSLNKLENLNSFEDLDAENDEPLVETKKSDKQARISPKDSGSKSKVSSRNVQEGRAKLKKEDVSKQTAIKSSKSVRADAKMIAERKRVGELSAVSSRETRKSSPASAPKEMVAARDSGGVGKLANKATTDDSKLSKPLVDSPEGSADGLGASQEKETSAAKKAELAKETRKAETELPKKQESAVASGVSGNEDQPVVAARTTATTPGGEDPGCAKAEAEAKRAAAAKSAADKLFYYRRALRFCPSEARYHTEIGRVYSVIGRNEDAIYEFRQALDLNPSSNEAKSELSKLGG